MEKLKSVLGQDVFVVILIFGDTKISESGELMEVNEPNNYIVLSVIPWGECKRSIPIDSSNIKLLKVYDRGGRVIYDVEVSN